MTDYCAAGVLAAHSDPSLDEFFPMRSPCGFCAWLPQRHRVIDSAAGMLAAGDDEETVADELSLSAEAVAAVRVWMAKYPGAWQ